MSDAQKPCLALVINAHLPFVRRPEFPDYFEERWLYEAVSECYLPLLRAFRRLESDHVHFRLTLSISPTLQSMLADPLLQTRYLAYLDRQLAFAVKEEQRLASSPSLLALAGMYHKLYASARSDFVDIYQNNVLKGFDYFHKKGMLELITSASTHAFLPLYGEYPESVSAQIETALISHRKNFGKTPAGFWLPHLGFYPKLDRSLKAYNLVYTFLDPRAVTTADPPPFAAGFCPIKTSCGFHAFIRDPASTKAVLDPDSGYPAAREYRDFYRDVGYDLPDELVAEFLPDGKTRVPTGFKYYAIDMDGDHKREYDIEKAALKIQEHASNFVYNRALCLRRAQEQLEAPALLVAAFDAELFGHWWFEGVDWLEAVLRALAAEDSELRCVSPTDYLEISPESQSLQPEFSSWVEDGFAGPWLEQSNAWLLRHIHKAAERMVELAERFPNEYGLKERALNQAAREILLSQSSDWAFLMRNPSSAGFAQAQLEDAIGNFTKIYDMLSRNVINTEWMTKLEKRNNLFPFINYRMFRRKL